MKVDNQLISEISSVMKLQFAENDLEDLVQETNKILTMLDQLKEVDTTEVEGTFHGVVRRETELRADEIVKNEKETQAILDNTKNKKDNLIQVPAMLDDGEGGA